VEDPEDYEWKPKSKVQGVLLVKSCKDISFDQLLFISNTPCSVTETPV